MNLNLWYIDHLTLIQAAMVNIMLALSIQVSLRAGVFSFAGVGFYGIGSYTTAILTIRYDLPVVVTIGAAMILSAVVGYALSWIIGRLDGIYLGMATIAFVLVLAVVAVNGGSLTGGPQGLFGSLASLPMAAIYGVVIVAVVLLAISERGRMGRRIEAVRDDPELATAMGVNVPRVRRLSFVASGLLGGCAGGLHAIIRTTVSQEDFSFSLVVLALTIIIVGGTRSWLGAVIGAIVFTWLPTALSFVGEWHAVVYGVIVALAAVWVPGGVVGFVTDRYRAYDARRRRSAVTEARDRTVEASPDAAMLELVTAQPRPGDSP